MIKKLSGLLLAVVIILTGCLGEDIDNTIVVGASSVPHAEILEAARDEIKNSGYELEIVVFDDYIMPNKALLNGDIDANYFQHKPYLNSQIEEFGYDFTAVSDIHIEPINIYSKVYEDIDDIKEGSTIYMSNSVSDQARVLALLETNGLIKLDDSVDRSIASFDDIIDNPYDLLFDYDYEPSLLASIYENNEGDLVAINTNYAIANNLNLDEAIISESSESDYANALVVNTSDVDSEKTQVLKSALTSDSVKTFINETYDGAVIPAF